MENPDTNFGALTRAWLLEKAHLARANDTELAAYRKRMTDSREAALTVLAEAVIASADPKMAVFNIVNAAQSVKKQTRGEGVSPLWKGFEINPQQLAGEVRDKVLILDETLNLDEQIKKTA